MYVVILFDRKQNSTAENHLLFQGHAWLFLSPQRN